MKLVQSIEQLKSEIASLQGAIEAIQNEHPRPVDPASDGPFSLLTSALSRIEHDRASKEFAQEKKARISAAETALQAMRQQLAQKESELSELEKTAAEGLAKLQGHADRLNALVTDFQGAYQKLIDEMKAIASEIEPNNLELHNRRPLYVRFEKLGLPHALVDDRAIVILPEGEQHNYNKPAPQPTPFVMPAPPTEQQRVEMRISQTCNAIGRGRDAQGAIEEYRQTGKVPAWLQLTSSTVGAA